MGLCEQEIADVLSTAPKQGDDTAAASQLGAKMASSLQDIVAGAVLNATTGGSTQCSEELLASFQAKLTETATALYRTELAARHQAMAQAECARAAETAENRAEGVSAESSTAAEALRAELAARQNGLTAKPEEGNAADGLQAEARARALGNKEEEGSLEASRMRAGGRSRSPAGGGAARHCG